ncbi:AIPR family protein [Roseovarius sp. Pro17]|uniref:AIPR family protein n=1 Tax=Roseovarius sp. Pro17 TaxID=3108175 RepID=UPI002D776628|nr:AIPR family protein [Roseovarius sp. Pro17]
MEETIKYHAAIIAELREISDESSVPSEVAFFERMANRLEMEGEIVTADWVGFSDRSSGKPVRIDAIGGDPRESEGVLSVIVSDFHPEATPIKINAADAKKSFGSLINFVAASRRAAFRSELIDGSSEAGAASMITSAWSSITKVKLILMTNAIYSARTDAVLAGKIADIPVTYNVWDLSRFHRFETSGHAREKIVVNFQDDFGAALPALAASKSGDRLDSYLIVMGGAQLARIYDKWGARLLESNVRSFLQARGAVNRGIRDTIKEEPEMFFSYNNGLSATADEVEVVRSENGLQIVKATNLQIVNGGQTTASLHNALSLSPETLDNVHVQLKLTVVPDEVSEEIVPFISKYANSQNKVSAADFFSNHPFHMRMEQFSRRLLAPAAEGTNKETKWFYERARGQYLVERAKKSPAEKRRFDLENPKAQYFVKTDLAKVEMSFRMQPDTVSKGAQKNFGTFAQTVGSEWSRSDSKFDETWFKRLVAKIIIFRHLEKVVPKQPWYPGGYRANIITYAIAKVVSDAHEAEKLIDLDSVWRAQFVPRALNDTLLIAAEAATAVITAPEAGVNNITEWGKKQACWATIERAEVEYGDDFDNCVIAPEVARSTQRDDRRNTSMDAEITAQQNVIAAGAPVWSRLRDWGRLNRMFSPTEDGILRTCSMLPGRIPSGKQSVIAEQIMSRARDEGYIDEADTPRIRISAISRPH